ncbi:MAG: electron transfer flavoprotein subunit beta [Acidiferrobacteraceae bacterium]|nr:electron transfer flavoprotein subunit beta [Acidiferrobacteraceae bacterium]|tara:strand:- start:440 stop:1189 length:750 start_codon:yes stop_codon:yes gene_type:complete
MKVLVPIKRVIDANIKIRVKSDSSAVELNNVKMAMNPFCEIAVEEAIRLREAGLVEEIILVTIGAPQCQETIRTGLAMGADRGVLVEADNDTEPLGVAKLIHAITLRENPRLVLLGKQAIDGDNNQTGQMLAGLLGWSIGSFISKLEVDGDNVNVVREVDGGLEKVALSLPAVATVDLRLNEPRYASLPNIMKAKKKPIDVLTPEELGVDVSRRTRVVNVEEPPGRDAGVQVSSAEELVDKLRNEAKVI